MLDPSLPWLGSGYRNFKEKTFLRPHSAADTANYRFLENGSNRPELRSTTPSSHQHRRVQSATHVRVHNAIASNVRQRLSTRPRSARSTDNFKNEKVGCYNYSPETLRALSLSRRPKSASGALLRHHRPSSAQNKSVTQVERLHHNHEHVIRQFVTDTGDGAMHSCPYCPVDCRPASSSANRPTSSTGLLASHLPSHYDRRSISNRPRTAPTTRREVSRLPRHNNVKRGHIAYYSHFVSKIPLHPRDHTPSPPPRRRQAFQEEQTPVAMVEDDDDEEEEFDDELSASELDFEEEIEKIPSPIPPQEEPKTEPPEEAMEAWSVAPTPTPIASRRNSEQEAVPEIELPPSPIPVPPPMVEKPPSPPPKSPSPPPRTPTPPPKAPTPPPKSPTPPPPQLTSRTPKECAHKPKAPIPPLPRVKKEVRIQEPPKEAPREEVIVKKEKKPIEIVKKVAEKSPVDPPPPAPVKPALKKTPSQTEPEEVAPPIKLDPPPLPPPPEPVKEIEVVQEPVRDETDSSPPKEEAPPAEEKKKLGPPPKVKVDVFTMDPQTMRELLDIQMKLKRRGGNLSDDEDEPPPSSLMNFVRPTSRMLKQSEWIRGRIALSRRAARFELPMDVGDLAEMTPKEYLRLYCIISQRRRALYKKSFLKVDKDNDGKINRKELDKGVMDALVDSIQADRVSEVLGYLGEEDTNIFTSRFFATFCALLERLFYREFTKEDGGERKEEREKELLEEADFTGLDWKLQGQYVNPTLKKLLYMI